jgi:hypothetical protein
MRRGRGRAKLEAARGQANPAPNSSESHYFFTTGAAVLSLAFEVDFLLDFLLFFAAGFDATVEEAEEVCAAGAAGLAGAVCAAKVKGRLAAVRAMAIKVVFMVFLPAGLFCFSRSQIHTALLRAEFR